jgi:dihydrofolate reductase
MPTAKRIAIIGGGDLNGRLAQLDVIDEIILDIEPVALGSGIRLFGNHDVQFKLELMESRRIGENTIQNRFAIIKEKVND